MPERASELPLEALRGALQLFSLNGRQLAPADAVTVLGYTVDTNDLIIGGPGGEASLLSPQGETVRLVLNSGDCFARSAIDPTTAEPR